MSVREKLQFTVSLDHPVVLVLEPTWGVEKQSKGDDDEGGDDGEQDDQPGVHSHPASNLSKFVKISINPGQSLCCGGG